MKIWLDISNSPHVNLFAGMIDDLGRRNDIVVTARPLANTLDLLDLHAIRHTVVGRHYGAGRLAKACGYPVRVYQLWRFLKDRNVDVAVSQSSFHSPVVSRLLGVRSVYMNDNEHALGNVPAFTAASVILVPEFLSAERLRRLYIRPAKVVRYPGLKEGIYLHQMENVLSGSGRSWGGGRRSVYVRPEPWAAQYYRGRTNFLDDLLLGLKKEVDVTVLPRGEEQSKRYAEARFQGIRVVTGAVGLAQIAPDCDLFIGAGGTMTREMSVLGIPTVSVYQDELLDVDRHLLETGALVHAPSLTAAEALRFLDESARRPPDRGLLEKGRQAYQLVKATILNT